MAIIFIHTNKKLYEKTANYRLLLRFDSIHIKTHHEPSQLQTIICTITLFETKDQQCCIFVMFLFLITFYSKSIFMPGGTKWSGSGSPGRRIPLPPRTGNRPRPRPIIPTLPTFGP